MQPAPAIADGAPAPDGPAAVGAPPGRALHLPVYFYSHTKGDARSFSNFYPSDFRMTHAWLPTPRECVYTSGEQAIMHAKALLMGDARSASAVMSAKTPAQCKALGRKVAFFDQDRWDKHVALVAFEVVKCKFEQNPNLASLLKATGDRPIAEAAPRDKIWGIGLDEKAAALGAPWRGKNLLGETLMRVRAHLR